MNKNPLYPTLIEEEPPELEQKTTIAVSRKLHTQLNQIKKDNNLNCLENALKHLLKNQNEVPK